jgi:uncharacterized repeat protein (TIGR03943 family)
MNRLAGPLQVLVALTWSAFLFRLWWSGDLVRYVGSLTAWVVPAGAVIFALVAIASAVRIRDARPGSWSAPLLLMAPLAFVALAPSAELGAYAAAKKLAPAPPVASAKPAPLKKGPLGVYDLHYVTQVDDAAAAMGIAPGMRVDVTGFVSHPKGNAHGTFAITRFVILCCIADAEAYQAQVDASGLARSDYEDDTWLRVQGTVAVSGKRLVVRASRVEEVQQPRDPYARRRL